MIAAPQSDELGLSFGSVETVRVCIAGLLVVWIQIFIVETNVAAIDVGSIGFAVPLSMVIDLPVALIVTLAVRQPAVAPWFGFGLGLAVDSYQPSSFGLHAGLFCLAAAAAPKILALAPGVRSFASGVGSIGAFVLIARSTITAIAGSHPQSVVSASASVIASTALVIAFAYPFAGFLDRRSRRMRYLNRSVISAATSPLQRARSAASGGRRR